MPEENVFAPATLRARLIALLYDLLPLAGLWFLGGVIALAVRGGDFDAHPAADKMILQAILLIFTAGYFVISWMRGGQTIGMRAWRVKLVDERGGRIAWIRALLRFFLASVSLLFLGAGFWWSLFDPERRTVHDRLAHTRMIAVPKR